MSSSTYLQFFTGSLLQIPPFQWSHRSQKMLTVRLSKRLPTLTSSIPSNTFWRKDLFMRWEFLMSPEATKTSDLLTALLLFDSWWYKIWRDSRNHGPSPPFFRFSDYERLMLLANMNTDLPDIVGEVRDIKTTYSEETSAWSHRDTTICLSVFDGLSRLLHHKLVTSGVEPLVMNINLKLVGGRLISPHTCSAFLFMFFVGTLQFLIS